MTPAGTPFERGHRLGKYEIIGRISVGGMAELYLASLSGQGGFKKFVAIKRILPSVAEQGSFLKMFLDEARISASLSHSNIAQVFELTEDPDSREPVLAMEFVAGQNLAQVIRRARARHVELPLGFSCRVLHDALLGLHSAHHFVDPTSGKPMPVIHRDVNPRNVMVTYTGGTKLIDFGIAKARGRLDSTQVGMVKGTLQYMSPEQVLQGELDGRSDLFAASVVLYELLSGRRVFDDDSDGALFTHIVKGEVRPLREVAPAVPERLAAAVMKGLSRSPDDRWRSGREYARALDHAVEELFDEEQVAALMDRLFEDKIAVTRSLLQSTSTDATYANLKLMAQTSDEGDSKPALPQPIAEVPTDSQRRRVDTQSPSATIVVDEPVGGTDRTEANLEAVPTGKLPAIAVKDEPSERPTTMDRPVLAEPRRTPGGAPSEGKRRTLDGQPAVRKPPSEPTLPRPTDPAGGSEATLSEVSDPGPAPKPARPARKPTSEGRVLQPVPERPVGDGSSAWLVLVLVLLGLVVAAGLAVIVMTKPPPEAPGAPAPVPLQPGPPPRPR